MKILKPTVLTDAMIVSSTVAEPDAGEVAWSNTTAYTERQECYLGHRRYRAVVANTGVRPGAETEFPTKWVDIGPTNKMAMFDDVVGTTTVGASPLTVVLRPGSTTGLALMELSGRTAIARMKTATGGTVVYEKTIDLDGTIIESFYDWFFVEYEQLSDVVLTDLPGHFNNCELTVTVTATSGRPAIGVCKPGLVVELGRVQAGASVGILDYSSKDTNTFGQTSVVQRSYSKRGNFSIVTERARFNKIYRTLASLRATPCVYIGTEAAGYEPLLIYGYFRDFSIDVAYQQHHLCSLEIEGLV